MTPTVLPPSPPPEAPPPEESQAERFGDPRQLLSQILADLITFLLHAVPTKPAAPEAWAALGRLDKTRRDLQRATDQEATEMTDPHGRVQYLPEDKGGV